jgi:hypothetical protein
VDEVEELRHLGDVEVGDLLAHHLGGHRGHARQAHHRVRHVGRGVAQGDELQVAHRLLVDDLEAPEGEEDVDLDALPSAALARTRPG